jgi:hypothetical protein
MTNFNFTEQDVKIAFIKAPPAVQEAVGSPEFRETLAVMGRKHGLNEKQIEELVNTTGLFLLGLMPKEQFADALTKELELEAEAGKRLSGDVVALMFDSILSSPTSAPAAPSRNQPLFEDNRCRVTFTTLEIGPTTYPMNKVGSVMQPLQLDFPLGGFLINALLALFGLALMATFSAGGLVVGLIFMAIGGFNIKSMFERPWWVNVTFTTGEELRISRKQKEVVEDIYRALKTALRGE